MPRHDPPEYRQEFAEFLSSNHSYEDPNMTPNKKKIDRRRGPSADTIRNRERLAEQQKAVRGAASGPTAKGDRLVKKAEAVQKKLRAVQEKARMEQVRADGRGGKVDPATAALLYAEAEALHRLYVDLVQKAQAAYAAV